MSLPIERWVRQALRLEDRYGFADRRSMPPKRLLSDIHDLAEFEMQRWHHKQRELRRGNLPLNTEGVYAGPGSMPPAGAIPNVASISGEVAVWDPTKWSSFPALTSLAPAGYRIAASYQMITSTSPANGQWYPKWGTVVTGAALSAIPAAQALTASITTNWTVEGMVTVRGLGAPGAANGKVTAFCTLFGIVAAAGVGTPTVTQITGHTEASFDASAAQGFVWAAVHTVTTINYSVQQIHWLDWN